MDHTKHESFPQLPDETNVWRYLDLAKLLSMLKRQEFYLSRLDVMDDRFEGSIPIKSKEGEQVLLERITEILPKDANPGARKKMQENLLNFPASMTRMRKALISCVYVNCWRYGEESEGMWRLYCGQSEGVAIKTTFKKLRSCVQGENTFIGMVRYIDYSHESLDTGNLLNAVMYKRKGFEHEQEVLILRADLQALGSVESRNSKLGVSLAFELENTVEEIVVSPYASTWYHDVVRDAVQMINPKLLSRVRWSSLYGDPLY